MSVSVSRADGVTVLTLTSDQSSACPPLCQLLGALCYSPRLCSRKSRLTPHRLGAQTVLGALWIITALLHIGLGVLIINIRGAQVYALRDTYCPVWLGVLFLLLGLCSLLSEKYPRPIFVLLSGIVNLVGFGLSITATVFYSVDIDSPGFYHWCNEDRYTGYSWETPAPTTVSPLEESLLQRCFQARDLAQALTSSIRAVLVVLSCLNICLSLSSSIISFQTLKHGATANRPLLKEAKE